jgi:hypothetical protein
MQILSTLLIIGDIQITMKMNQSAKTTLQLIILSLCIIFNDKNAFILAKTYYIANGALCLLHGSYANMVQNAIIVGSLVVSYNIFLIKLLCMVVAAELFPSCILEFSHVLVIIYISIAMCEMHTDFYSMIVSISQILISCVRIIRADVVYDSKSRFEL